MRQWLNLEILLTKQDTTTLILGNETTGKYPIKKDNALFNSIMSFDYENNERSIPIEVYIDSMSDIREFRDFFESTNSYEKSKVYKLKILANDIFYNGICTLENDYEVTEIADLYGSNIATIKFDLRMEDPYFYSDFTYDQNIGSQSIDYFELPITMNKPYYLFSFMSPLTPHIINNRGNEDNGVIIDILSSANLVNPKIKNITTGFSMSLNLKTNLNDMIKIDTKEKTVHVNGILKINVKNIGDKWLKLEQGINIIEITSGSGIEKSIVHMSFRDKYRAIV